MKKFLFVLCATLVTGSLIGTSTLNAAQEQNSTDINNYKSHYAADMLISDEVAPTAVPAFVAGALAGGLIYDAAKAGVTKYNQMYKAGGVDKFAAKYYDSSTKYATYGPESDEEYSFGR